MIFKIDVYLLTAASIFAIYASSKSVTVNYDKKYDNPHTLLKTLACSNGENGIIKPTGFTELGQLSIFPYVGAVGNLVGWDLPYCGKCYVVRYKKKRVKIITVDTAAPGTINLSLTAMNALTSDNAVEFGQVKAHARQAPCDNPGGRIEFDGGDEN